MKHSILSVGIATRDRPAALARCLDGLLSGAVLPCEIVVIDQSRTDGARAIVEARQDGEAGVRLNRVRQAPRGLSASRNAAIAHTRGPVIVFTDDDCVPDRLWIDRLDESFASRHAPDAVTGRVLALGPPRPGTHAVSLRTGTERIDYRGRTVPWQVGTGANIAVSRQWILRLGGFDERLGAGSPGRAGEDADIIYRLLVEGAQVRYEPGAIVYHERLSDARRLATRTGYGYGIGAVCGIHFRRGDLFALPMFGSWSRSVIRQAWRAARSGNRFELYQRWLSVRGTVAGVAYGLRAHARSGPRNP